MVETQGKTQVGQLSASGVYKAVGRLDAEEVGISGLLKAKGSANISRLDSSGVLKILGQLNSETIDIKLDRNNSYVKGDIRASSIRTQRPKGYGKGKLEAESIYAEEVDLIDTKARLIRAKMIRLGKGCVVDRVEYYERLDIEANAQVREKVKLDSFD